ncbi:MAG: hypothetical protein ACXW2P_05325 [Thermoanaerobaculia bacterium]
MKRLIPLLFCLVLLASCGGDSATQIADLEKKSADLTQRVKTLETNLLSAEKQLIAHQQAMQALAQRQREMENYFNKLQTGQN